MVERDLEGRWQAWLTEHNRRSAWVVLGLTGTCYPLFGILDWLVAPPEWLWLLWGSRGVVFVCTVVVFLLTRRPVFERHAVALTTAFMIVVAGGIAVMIFVMGGLGSVYTPGLILVSIAVTIFLWPPRVAMFFQGSLLAMFLLPNLHQFDASMIEATVLNLFFLVFATFFMTASQMFGYQGRKAEFTAQVKLERTTANLEEAHEELKRLDRFKSQFFANITHELKTPLAMVLASVELIAAEDMGPLTEQQRTTLEGIFHNGLKLLRMIGDILDLSKLDESRVRLRIQDQDVICYMEQLIQQVEPLVHRKGIQLALETDLDSCTLCWDSERMERVFVNLLSNAAKFTPDGGNITVSVTQDADEVLVCVADSGPGFPADQAEAVFERFYQVDMAATRKHGGSGIGLALAREFVGLHGGRIWAESAVDEGARFFVRLKTGRDHFAPEVLDRRSARRAVHGNRRSGDQGLSEWTGMLSERADYRLLQIADATERRVVARHPHQERRQHSVLVVDDTPDILRAVHLTLHAYFRVYTAKDGLEGLQLANEILPSLVITDLMMPGIDGHELVRRLRAGPATKQIPIIMLSARGRTSDRVAGLDAGANSYLAKPFSPHELRAAVNALLNVQDIQSEVQLERRMDALETMAAGLAHEFNNALNQIRPALSMVRTDSDSLSALLSDIGTDAATPDGISRAGKLATRIGRLQDRASTGAERIASTVKLMGHYATEGKERTTRPHDVFESVREVLTIVRPPIGQEVAIGTHLEGYGVIPCVPEEIHQLITNMLSNAFHAVPADSGRVEVSGQRFGDRLIIRISDNGPGVPEQIRDRIFHPFFTTKAPGRGTGLGLNIAWRIAEGHAGTLRLIDGPLPGACFELALPLEQSENESSTDQAATEE